ncbi:transmembrane protein 70, mitochondrial isoform 2-T2 [Vipera latastei]
MLLVAGLRLHAPGLKLWQQSAGRCRALQPAKRLAGIPEKRQSFTASHCKLLTPLGSPRAFGSWFWLGENKQVPFFHAESLYRFSTSSLEEHSEYGRLIYSGSLSKTVLGVKIFCVTTSIITASMLFGIIHKVHILNRADHSLDSEGVKEPIYIKIEQPSLNRGGGIRHHCLLFTTQSFQQFEEDSIAICTLIHKTLINLKVASTTPRESANDQMTATNIKPPISPPPTATTTIQSELKKLLG